ncbi:exodeoxyribonuclease VII large subunit [Ilumatobacter sp.]|uniref:exodeoxyribonuclease VII large subunit n=1 Tax=Ilumatobacter sp. TaxID=1967498 RepID=UPI0037528D1B
MLAEANVETIQHRVAVTGPRAPVLIAQALDRLALDPRPAVTLLVRGGGPVSDFAVYDDPLVGIAIDRHRHPVVTGLGHATNTTLADRAAHTACITPTAAAQHVHL